MPEAGSYRLDPAHTFVRFRAQHLVVGRVRGRFASVSGQITVAEDPLDSSVEVRVDMASVTTLLQARDDDLRSEHYLDVANHPTMTFSSTPIIEEPVEGGRHPVCRPRHPP